MKHRFSPFLLFNLFALSPVFAEELKSPNLGPEWAGVYGGMIGGYSVGTSSQQYIGGPQQTGIYPLSGAFGGLNAGFNYQFGKWVIGLDSDLLAARLSGTKSAAFHSEMNGIFLVRARFGYSVGRFLPFIGLGPAYSRFSSTGTFAGVPTISAAQMRSGWTFSLGTDYSLTPNLKARAEYMYICFGQALVGHADNVTAMGHYFRVGLDYKFDVPGLRREDETPAANGPYNWSGVYFGPSIGGGAISQQTSFTANGVPIGAVNGASAGGITGFGLQGTVGVEAGANWQIGNLVLGAETDFHLSQLSGLGTNAHFRANLAGTPGALQQSDTVGEQGTVRARFGYAMDRWLVYGTAGLAYADLSSQSTFTVNGGTVATEVESTRIGPVLGIGVERAIWGNWTTRLEYMYANFGKASYAFTAPAPYNSVGSNINFSEHILRVGFNYRLN